jgi:hypothetical protein
MGSVSGVLGSARYLGVCVWEFAHGPRGWGSGVNCIASDGMS